MLRQRHPHPPEKLKSAFVGVVVGTRIGGEDPRSGGDSKVVEGRRGTSPNPRSLAEYGCLWSLDRGSWGRMRGRGVLGVGSQGGEVSGDVEGMGDGFIPRAFM